MQELTGVLCVGVHVSAYSDWPDSIVPNRALGIIIVVIQ